MTETPRQELARLRWENAQLKMHLAGYLWMQSTLWPALARIRQRPHPDGEES